MARDPDAPRYARQRAFAGIGAAGQERLLAASVVVVGAGALGAAAADQLARAGIGRLRIIDRDVIEESNLGRQALYTAEDVRRDLPKAVALAAHLAAINPDIAIDPRVVDLNAATADEALGGCDLIIDGTDNLGTRYVVNDWAVRAGVTWIYGACIAARGMTGVIIPGDTPCLRCLYPEPPPPGTTDTCETAGIIAPAANIIASLQVAEALKLLVGARDHVRRGWLSLDLWPFRVHAFGGDRPERDAACP